MAEARDRQSGDAGLGLAISDRVIRTHGGSIIARNIAPKGLIIEILLPEAEESLSSEAGTDHSDGQF